MSLLQEMGIQQWRLRGRKLVATVNIEPSLAIEGARDLSQAPSLKATQSPDSEPNVSASSALVKGVGQSPLVNDTLTVEKQSAPHPSEPKPAFQGSPKGHLPQKELVQEKSTNMAAEQALEPSVSKVHDAPALPLVTTGIDTVTSSKEKAPVSEFEMPSLRPAPLPFESPVEVDLRFAERETSEPEHLAAEPTRFAQAPDYNDTDIPSVDFSEVDGLSVYDITPDEAVGHSDRLEPVGQDKTQSESSNKPGSAELSQLDWRALQARISDDSDCPSCGQQQSVLGYGDVLADWMFIADALTTPELQAQQLFVGRAAQLFEGILSACGLQREQVYSTTVFKCSPPEDLSLSPQCDKLIHRQVELIQPKVIVTFGELSSQAVLHANESFEQLSKGRHSYAGTSCLVIPCHAPQHLLANPVLKARLWRELKLAMQNFN